MNIVGELLGYVAGICTAITFLPQSFQTIKNKDIHGLSLSTYIIYCIGMLAWIAYGFYMHSIQMILFNSISLFFAVIILYIIITHRK